jgi:protein HOOK3
VEQLDELRRKHAELEVDFENQSKELTIAKSDRKLRGYPKVPVAYGRPQ